jgi:hypothetical protein
MNGANVQIKVFSLIVLAIFIVLYPAQADETNGASPAKIGATAADKHYGENMVVTGKVVQITIRPNTVFLNFDLPYPDSPFACVIFSRFTNQFGDLPSLKGASVEVSGVITNYHNKPQIVLTNARQLTINALATVDQTPSPPAVVESPPTKPVANLAKRPPAATTTPAGGPQTLLWLAGCLAGCLALFLIVRIIARRSALQATSAFLLESKAQTGQLVVAPSSERPPYVQIEMDGSTQTRSQTWQPGPAADRETAGMPEAVRAGVIANLSHWLKQKMVRRLVSDREQLLATQQAAALKVLAVDERLAKIEHHIEQRNQDYERRIDELLKALITAEAENREMIRAQITFLKAEMEKARLKAEQQGDEHPQY